MVPNGTQMVPVYPASLLATIPPAPARTEWRLKTRRNQDWNVYACSVTQSCLILCDFMNNSLPRLFHLWNFPGNCGVDCHFLLQGIFLTQGLSPHLFLLRQWQSLYHCLTWEAYWNVYTVAQNVKNKTKGILVFMSVTLEFWGPYLHWKCSWGRGEMFKFAG